MSFSRTSSGLDARYLFYSEVLVYVEGHTDIHFYDEALRNSNHRIKAVGGKTECEKLAKRLEQYDRPYVVVLDGDYEILVRTRSRHRRIVLLHRHSYENYLIEEEPINQFCRNRAHLEDSLAILLSNSEFEQFLEKTEHNFKELIVLDVAHQHSGTGYDVLPDKPDRFFTSQKKVDFRDNQIQKWRTKAANQIDSQKVADARTLVEKYLEKHRFIDLLPGHFAFGILRRLIIDTINKKRRAPNISNDEIQLFLSSAVWQLVKTRDHDSLKRRLRQAVREAQRMLKSNSSQTP